MKRMAIVGVVGFMLTSSLAFGQDVPTENNESMAEPIVGEMEVYESDATRSVLLPKAPEPIPSIPSSTTSTYQSIDMNGNCDCDDGDMNCGYYRWWDDDVVTAFNDPDFAGCVLTSATLSMKYGDVDFYDQGAFNAELDVVQFGPGSLDVLKGYNNSWEGASWDVKDRVSANTGDFIDFAVNVDAVHTYDYWAVYLCEAVLQTDWCCGTNCPVPVPPNTIDVIK